MFNLRRVLTTGLLLLLSTSSWSATEKPRVHESRSSLRITAGAPIPSEVSNDSQAKAISRDAAIALGQAELLNYVLQKKAKSKKTLAQAEIPSIELQTSIRGMVAGAQVKETRWDQTHCWVTLVMDKTDLKRVLQKN